MYIRNDDKIVRRIRQIIDIANTLIIVFTVFLVVFTFMDVKDRMDMFPYIFIMGAVVNFLAGVKHFISGKKGLGLVSCLAFVFLIFVSGIAQTVIGGM